MERSSGVTFVAFIGAVLRWFTLGAIRRTTGRTG